MRRSRAIATAAIALSAVTGLAACGSSGSNNAPSSANGNKVTLTWWNNANTQPLLGVFQGVIKSFEATHPNVTIQNVPMQNEQFKTKITPALRGSNPPDIYQQWGSGGEATQVKTGKLADISSYVGTAMAPFGTPAKSWQANGKWYGVPYDLHVVGFWYRKDLFTKAGITAPPKTIDELKADDAKLKAKGIAPITVGAKDGWPVAFWWEYFAVRECSAADIQSAMTKVDLSASCFTKASKDLYDFTKTNPFEKGFQGVAAQNTPTSSVGLLMNGKAAMELQGDWDPGAGASLTPDKNVASKLGWFPFPAVTGGAGDPTAVLGGGDGFSCTTGAAEPACAQFLQYLTTPDIQRKLLGAGVGLPVNPEAADALSVAAEHDAQKANSAASSIAIYFDTAMPTTPGQNLDNAIAKWFATPEPTGADIIKSVQGPA